MPRRIILGLIVGLAAVGLAQSQTREQKVLADKKKFEAGDLWIYNDLAKGFAEAKKTGKPILAVLRCIPCEECVKLDDDLVHENPRVRALLDQFVCVRIVSTNGLDLALFQFDYDQSFAAFMLNADGAIYGRFGTRSHRTYWSDDVSVDGLAQALQGALELHRNYPKNRAELAAKKGPPPAVATPEQMPFLKGKYGPRITYEAKVVQSCIHCHQIGDAQRQQFRTQGQPMPDDVLFPYPHPKSLGLILDPRERATVLTVEADTPAAQAGFQKGDVIVKLAGQTLLSIADVQWVLQRTPSEAELTAEVRRGDRTMSLTWKLAKGWRQRGDISWRASSWALRRMGSGGMLLETVPDAERPKGLADGVMALRAKHVGQFGPHAAAKNAGFQQGDILIRFAGRSDLLREGDLLAYAINQHKVGERVAVTILRDGKKIELMLPMQE